MLILEEVRCPDCNRMLGLIKGQAEIRCPKCKSTWMIDTDARKIYKKAERQRQSAR